MNELLTQMFDIGEVLDLLDPQGVIYLALMLLIFVGAKWIHDLVTPYELTDQLVREDNPAVALVFAGYLLAIGVILQGVLAQEPVATGAATPQRALLADLWSTLLWGGIGVVLLEVARVVDDKLLLYRFSNTKELVEDRNMGTAAVEFGSLVGTGLVIRAVLSGDDLGLAASLVATAVYFVAAQLAFVLFGLLYQRVTRYDVHAEIERDNVAAGVALGGSLLAIGVQMSSYLTRYDSLLGLVVWLVIGMFLLLTSRYILDKWVLPGALLDDEISRDQNWGAALVESGAALSVAYLIGTAF